MPLLNTARDRTLIWRLLHSSRPKTARPKQKCECGDGQQGDIQWGVPASAGGTWVGMKGDSGSLNLMVGHIGEEADRATWVGDELGSAPRV